MPQWCWCRNGAGADAGNVYATQGDSIKIDPQFVDGTDTIIANEINGGCQLKLTSTRQTVTHGLVPSATF
eukprot:COSAG02_NODE_36729_length_451_cov_0.869318_1_plen_69_part_10